MVHPIGLSLWCITFGVMRHPTLPRRPTRVYSTSWDFPVRGPALIITFWFNQLRGVLYTRALTSPNSTYFLGSHTLDFVDRPPSLPRKSALTWPPLPLRCPIPQGFSRTTHIQNGRLHRQVLPLIFKLRARPPRSD